MGVWTFNDSVSEARREQLAGYDSFETIALSMMLVADVAAFIWGKYDGRELRGCGRAEFLLTVPSLIYDAFFNSPVGYRAQYAISVVQGELQNRMLIDMLTTKLIASVPSTADVAQVEGSLKGTEAKMWIYEEEVQHHLSEEAPEISFPRWQENCETSAGVRAPVGTKLVVYGGWLDDSARERLNPHKQRRSQDIYECGFS